MVLSVVMVAGFPTVNGNRLACFRRSSAWSASASIQRRAARFSRPEIWVFWALLGAMATVAFAIYQAGLAQTGAIALMTWPLAGLAGRFNNRVVVVGDGLHDGAVRGDDPRRRAVVRVRRSAQPHPAARGTVRGQHAGDGPSRLRHREPRRGDDRRAHRDAQPHRADPPPRRDRASSRAPPGSRSADRRSTSTASRPSTTRRGTRPATPSCATSPTCCAASCAPTTSPTAWAARSSLVVLPGADLDGHRRARRALRAAVGDEPIAGLRSRSRSASPPRRRATVLVGRGLRSRRRRALSGQAGRPRPRRQRRGSRGDSPPLFADPAFASHRHEVLGPGSPGRCG